MRCCGSRSTAEADEIAACRLPQAWPAGGVLCVGVGVATVFAYPQTLTDRGGTQCRCPFSQTQWPST
ncbi:hypothetical protein FMEAI12_6110021 [Parafrankia sp. Ea1.12]|nr:hypothetical protein FMEAI12_6110021 [Parafrankia sp. Ea1.12]